jgi:hypothetical protein
MQCTASYLLQVSYKGAIQDVGSTLHTVQKKTCSIILFTTKIYSCIRIYRISIYSVQQFIQIITSPKRHVLPVYSLRLRRCPSRANIRREYIPNTNTIYNVVHEYFIIEYTNKYILYKYMYRYNKTWMKNMNSMKICMKVENLWKTKKVLSQIFFSDGCVEQHARLKLVGSTTRREGCFLNISLDCTSF